MAVSDRHNIVVEDEVPHAKYRYVVRCGNNKDKKGCGWVGRCYTLEEVDKLGNGHLEAQGILTETSGMRQGGL